MVVTSAEEKMVMQHFPFIFLVLLFNYCHVGIFLTVAPFFPFHINFTSSEHKFATFLI